MATDQTSLRLGQADHGRLVSPDEFAGADFDEPWKYERVDGRLVVMFPDSEAHDDRTEPWLEHLYVYKIAHRDLVEKVVPEAWVRIDGLIDRIGDIGVFLRPTDGSTPIGRPERVPELMIEVVSESAKDRRRDYVEKKADYHSVGVREYVVVDRFRRTVTVYTHEAGGYAERVLKEGDVYESPMLPGLLIPLSDVF
jgi:Uma2 family endonuclease